MENVIYSIVAAVIGLGVLIVFHEFGHFLFAKMFGVGVITFSVGFGPKLLVKKKGETEYALSAFPLGGYVKMVGEDPDEEVQQADVEKSFAHKKTVAANGDCRSRSRIQPFTRGVSADDCICFLRRTGSIDASRRC